MKQHLEIISPVGMESVAKSALAPRLDTIAGKTICETYNESFKGEYMFPVYRELFKQKYPGVKIIPYTEFPISYWKGTPTYQRQMASEIARLAKERGCDALISGNGG